VRVWTGFIWLRMEVQLLALVNTEINFGLNKDGSFLDRLTD
jgi:hypothetical protein